MLPRPYLPPQSGQLAGREHCALVKAFLKGLSVCLAAEQVTSDIRPS